MPRTSALWRSKLRRLHTLTAWYREQHSAGAGEQAGDGTPAVQQTCLRDVPPSKRRRVASADAAATSPHRIEVLPTPAADGAAAASEQPVANDTAERVEIDVPDEALPSKPALKEPAARGGKRKLPARQCSEALAVRLVAGARAKSKPSPPTTPPPPTLPSQSGLDADAGTSASSTATARPPEPKPKLSASEEIERILAAECPEDLLRLARDGAGGQPSEEVVTQAWKRLVLLLHPDKLQRLGEEVRDAGAEALHRVHAAKDELRKRSQEVNVEVPDEPQRAGEARCLESAQGQRKFEISWVLPEAQNPARPVEAYEVWGPKYFSEIGDPYDWVLLATLPALQTQFVLVEEAPTQQDVMWAADRILRPTLPINVHAINGRGQSCPVSFELPWATEFPWLNGTPSVLCSQCFRMSACKGPWTKCSGCMASVPDQARVIVRCPDCQGEVLWGHGSNILRCTCCLRVFGKDLGQQWRPGTKPMHNGSQVPRHAPPRGARPHNGHGGGQENGGRGGGMNRNAW